MSAQDLQGASQKSCGVLQNLGPQIQWVQSYITGDTIHCIYIAPSEDLAMGRDVLPQRRVHGLRPRYHEGGVQHVAPRLGVFGFLLGRDDPAEDAVEGSIRIQAKRRKAVAAYLKPLAGAHVTPAYVPKGLAYAPLRAEGRLVTVGRDGAVEPRRAVQLPGTSSSTGCRRAGGSSSRRTTRTTRWPVWRSSGESPSEPQNPLSQADETLYGFACFIASVYFALLTAAVRFAAEQPLGGQKGRSTLTDPR